MLLSLAAIVLGLLVLAWSADRFVYGAAALARNWGVSPLIIGLTIVGFGTSAPELFVSATAAWQGKTTLAVGNAVGSNIANVGMVLGIAALAAPLTIRSRILKREYPVMFAAMLLAYGLLWDGYLSFWDGVILGLSLLALIFVTVVLGLRARPERDPGADPLADEFSLEVPRSESTGHAIFWLVLGLILLSASSQVLVWGAVDVAASLGVSDLIIGLTIVAIGTSLPEVATTLMSSLKGEDDIALGNVLGSNIFNMLGVIGIPGLLHPAMVDQGVLLRDFPVMLAITGLMLVFGYRARIGRFQGGLLLVLYMGYLTYLISTAGPAMS